MGVRVADLSELKKFAGVCTKPDLGGNWGSLQAYLSAARKATSEPAPFVRVVDIVWLNKTFLQDTYFPGRRLVATYTGPRRSTGGFASQAYVILDANLFNKLGAYHKQPIEVEYVASDSHDVLVVLP
jgi:hypothetical protein